MPTLLIDRFHWLRAIQNTNTGCGHYIGVIAAHAIEYSRGTGHFSISPAVKIRLAT
jgi:hypothetical protein